MKIRIQTKDLFTEPVIVDDLQTIVLLDDLGQPIFTASVVANRGIWTMSASDPNFHETIKKLGIQSREAKVVALDDIAQRPTK